MDWRVAVIGLFATALMDLGALAGTRLGFLRKGHLGLLARWLRQLTDGYWVPPRGDIRDVPSRPADGWIGLGLHYGIGVALAAVYFLLLREIQRPAEFKSAIAYGFTTNALPWFFMYPSMGFGFFGAKAPREAKLLPTSLVAHLNYGLGLWLGSLWIL